MCACACACVYVICDFQRCFEIDGKRISRGAGCMDKKETY